MVRVSVSSTSREGRQCPRIVHRTVRARTCGVSQILGVQFRFGIHPAIRIQLWNSPCANITEALVSLSEIASWAKPLQSMDTRLTGNGLQSEGAVYSRKQRRCDCDLKALHSSSHLILTTIYGIASQFCAQSPLSPTSSTVSSVQVPEPRSVVGERRRVGDEPRLGLPTLVGISAFVLPADEALVDQSEDRTRSRKSETDG